MFLKRILAFVIDWNLSAIPTLLFAFIFREIYKTQEASGIAILLLVLFVLLYPTLFVLRDVIFKGRSVAKRLLRLYVVDKNTNSLPSNKKLAIRNLFFFLYPIDAILLFVKKQTLGDMITETSVVSK